MTTTTTRHIGSCALCGYVVATDTATTEATCPDCWATISLSPVASTHSETAQCDDACMWASRPKCVCSCGGSNHSRGYVDPALVPPAIRSRDAVRKATVTDQRVARQAARTAELIAANPGLADLLDPEYRIVQLVPHLRALRGGRMTAAQIRKALTVLRCAQTYRLWADPVAA